MLPQVLTSMLTFHVASPFRRCL